MLWRTVVFVLVIVAVLAAVVNGCGKTPATVSSSEAPATTPPSTATVASASTDSTATSTVETTTMETTDPLSDSIAYARSLGGLSQEGATLFFVVGAATNTEAEAQALLEKALPSFGDMQSYFIVQQSDNFDGMEPGKWVVIEAYKENPSAENVDFGRRAFPNAYVVRAKVMTADPIPVYEDRLGL